MSGQMRQTTTFSVRSDCAVQDQAQEIHDIVDDLETFVNGTTAADRISSDDSLGASYKAVKGTVSLAGTIKHSLDDSHAWGFYAYNFDVLSAYIEDYVSALDEDAILCAVQDLPPWPSDQLPDQDTINKYRDYFQSAGTHIITGTSFGSRLELVSSTRLSISFANINSQ